MKPAGFRSLALALAVHYEESMSLENDFNRGCERQRADPSLLKQHLPTLAKEWYLGRGYVHWTLGIENRATGWLTPTFLNNWNNVLLHACARYRLVTPVYSLMPDHVHLMWLGLAESSDQRTAVEFLRKHLRASLAPAQWQNQPYDHVLDREEREQGAFERVAHYVLENPVRAKLAAAWEDYPYSGCCIPGYPEFDPRRPGYWSRFWRCYNFLVNVG